MGWWEIFATVGMLLMLFVRQHSKRSGRGGRSSLRSRRSSTRTRPKQTSSGRDHGRTFHITGCPRCRMIGPIPLTATRLEWRPWRVVWDCTGCGRTVAALVGDDALDVLLAAEVAGGMRLSEREIEEACLVDWDVEAQQL